MIENPGVLQELALLDHAVKGGRIHEMVIGTIPLAGTLGTGRCGDRHNETRLALEQPARNRGLAGTGGRRQDQHQPAPPDIDKSRWPRRLQIHDPPLSPTTRCRYSIFWACSRSCSMDALSSMPRLVKARSSALEQRVLASRLNSWHRKSSRRPIAP